MIKAVIFDAGGVLHESSTAVSDDVQQELGLTADQGLEIWADQMARLGQGDLDELEFWAELRDKYGIREVDPNEQLLSRAFARTMRPHTRVLAVARRLRRAGYKTAVLSDTIAPHAIVNEAVGNYEPFKYRFLSYELGIRKPDARIYRKALDVLKVKPSESIFIDDVPANVAAAEELGIHGIVFTNPDQFISELAGLLPGVDLESK